MMSENPVEVKDEEPILGMVHVSFLVLQANCAKRTCEPMPPPDVFRMYIKGNGLLV